MTAMSVFVRAAGGVVWRERSGPSTVAVIHRPRRDDWSLPKGKLRSGESWQAGALREIEEETGCEARIVGFAGAKLQLDRDVPKLVVYWHMHAVRDGELEEDGEVDEVAWLSPAEALARLDHASDRTLLLRAIAGYARRRPGSARAATLRSQIRERIVVEGRAAADAVEPFLRLVERAVTSGDALAARIAALARR
jgi:ADP-ribose pyrophosphatase YjhB (NUDIX family)